MTKQKDTDRAVTLRDFQEFTAFAAKAFATKQDLQEDLHSLREEIREEMRAHRDQILTSDDKLSKKLDTLLSEGAAKLARDDQQDDDIHALQARTAALEQRVVL